MTSAKSFFQTDCESIENPLIALSRNFGNTEAKLTSNSSKSIQNFIPGASAADLMTQEYLDKISQKTSLPNNFDVNNLITGLRIPENRVISNNVSNIPTSSIQNRLPQNLDYVNEYIQKMNLNDSFGLKNSLNKNNLFALMDNTWNNNNNNNLMNNIWQKNEENSSMNPFMNSIWNNNKQSSKNSIKIDDFSTEYLKKFDNAKVDEDKLTMKEDSKNDDWINEFLDKINAPFTDNLNNFTDSSSKISNNNENNELYNYVFDQANPYTNEEDSIVKAKEMFLNGNINEAVLHYEAALKQNPTNAEAWRLLGLCHAENEQDLSAISAFKNSYKYDPNNRKTMLAITVSLANEGMDHEAYNELKKWQTTFRDEETQQRNYFEDSYVDSESLEQQLLALLNTKQSKNNVEVYNALGIFYNLTHQYDKAIDAIKSAIQLAPEDPILWNRLGASLANSDFSVEALNAYRKALEIFPSYVRARYNLGIACMNLNCYREAIDHFINALKLQNSPDSSQIWYKLRSSIIRSTTDLLSSTTTSNNNNNFIMKNLMDALEAKNLEKICKLLEN